MYRLLTCLFVFFAALSSAALAGQCTTDTRAVVYSSKYLSTNFTAVSSATPGGVTLQMKDDPRIIVNFAMDTPSPSEGLSISKYLANVRSEFSSYVAAVKSEGRWIEMSTFPYDPIAWRIVEEVKLPDVGPSLVGRMYIRLNEDCLLAANFVAPSNIHLRSRWHAFSDAIANLRTDAASLVTPTQWEPEDTTPTGVKAIVIGYIMPMIAAFVGFTLLGHLTRLEPPSSYTRIVLACSALIILGAAFYQSNAFIEEFHELKYTDNALLLVTTGVIALFALLFFNQTSTVLSLATSCTTGLTLVSLSFFEWTPDPNISLVVGAAVLVMGALGFLSWHLGESFETPKARQKEFD